MHRKVVAQPRHGVHLVSVPDAPTNSSSVPDPLGPAETETLVRSQQLWEASRGSREEFFRTILESIGEGLLITDDQSRIIYVNSQLAQLTGYTRDELLGRTSYEMLLAKEDWPRQQRRLGERLSGKCEVYEHQLIRKNGERTWVQV